MARDETPPFTRGNTIYNGGTIDANNLMGVNYEGKEWWTEDTIYGSGQYLCIRAVRNSGVINLLPKRLVAFDNAFFGQRVNGYVASSSTGGFPVDELLPAAGVPVNDLFYIVVEGPAAVLTDLAGGANNVINAGDPLWGLAAASTGATTAGRVAVATTTGGTLTRDQDLYMIGFAMSAKTTANTNASELIYVHKWL